MDVTHKLLLDGFTNNDLIRVESRLLDVKSYRGSDNERMALNDHEFLEIITTIGLQQFKAMCDLSRKAANHCMICIDPNNQESVNHVKSLIAALKQANEEIANSKIFLVCSSDFSSLQQARYMLTISNKLGIRLLNYRDLSSEPCDIAKLLGVKNIENDFRSALEEYKMKFQKPSKFDACMQKLINLCHLKYEKCDALEWEKAAKINISEEEYKNHLLSLLYGDKESNRDLRKYASKSLGAKSSKKLNEMLMKSTMHRNIYNDYHHILAFAALNKLKEKGLPAEICQQICQLYIDVLQG